MDSELKPLKNDKIQSKNYTQIYLLEDYDPHLHRKLEHPTSNMDTLVHLVKGNIGTGVLAMPEAFKNAGLYMGLFGTLFIGYISTHCMQMLVACSNEMCRREKIPSMDYSELCYSVFKSGSYGLRRYARLARLAIDFFLCLTQLGVCSVYFLFVAANLQEIGSHYYEKIDVRLYIILLLVPIILLNFLKNLKYLAPVSLFASILFITGIAITFQYLLKDLPSTSSVKAFASWKTLPLFCGTVIYSFEGIGFVLPLENNMKTPKHFVGPMGILCTGMTVVTLLYTAVGFFGYLKFGNYVEASITLNLDSSSILAQAAQLMIALGVFFTYALVFYVPMKILKQWLQKYSSDSHPCITDGLLRTALIGFTCMVAISVPSLGPVISLVGALGSSSLALIFPPLLEILTFGLDGMGRFHWKLWKNLAIVYFGILSSILGTYTSFMLLMESYY